MDKDNQSTPTPKIPRTKNVWLRLIKYFISAIIVSYIFYWVLSQMELDSLKTLNNKRSELFLTMLSIMPAKGWGWFAFFGAMFVQLWGEWRYFHLKSFPKEKSSSNEK